MTLPAHVTGVQSMASAESGAFDAEDIDAARLLANCAVPTIEHARLARLTLTDETTATFKRRYYALRLQEEMGRARRGRSRLSVAFLDRDHFKQVHDAHGHEVGDLVLQAFADRVRDVIRRYDVLVRRSGDGLILVMPNSGLRQTQVVAQRVRRSLGSHSLQVGSLPGITQMVSIGVAEWDQAEPATEIGRRADQAMYEAQHAGRNRVCVALPLGSS